MNSKVENFLSNNKKEKLIIAIAIIIIILLLLIGLIAHNVNSLDDYDMSAVTLTDDTETYDGSEHSLEIEGDLPDGVSVSYTYNGSDVTGVTDTGTYDVVASFTGDTTEYNTISDMEATLTISNATIDTTDITFGDSTVTYDGSVHSLAISGELSDAVNVSYAYNGDDVTGETEVGVYTVVATLSEDNYATVTKSATLTINAASIDTTDITFGNSTVTYDGSKHSIEVSGVLPDGVSASYTYNGSNATGETAVGVYTVVATLSGDDYETKTLTATLTIEEEIEYTYTYDETTLTAELKKCLTTDATTITTPATLTNDGVTYNVTRIKTYCFSNCSDLESITISAGIISIANGAFYGLSNLESVTFEDSSTVKSFGEFCFQGCTSLESIEIPSGITSINVNCFYNCSSLANVTLPSGLESLKDCCFYCCASFTSITIPSSVTKISEKVFSGCASLETITFEDTSDWAYYLSGRTTRTSIDVSNSALNVKNFTQYYYRYIFVKESD